MIWSFYKELESLHLSDGRELKIIGRGQTYEYAWQSLYGNDTCTIPISNISDIRWESDPQNSAVLNLNINTVGGSVSYALTHNNPAIPFYEQLLSTPLLSSESSNPYPEQTTFTGTRD